MVGYKSFQIVHMRAEYDENMEAMLDAGEGKITVIGVR